MCCKHRSDRFTGGADRKIILWHKNKIVRTFTGHKDAVRGLVPMTDIGFASASNDRYATMLLHPVDPSHVEFSAATYCCGPSRATSSTATLHIRLTYILWPLCPPEILCLSARIERPVYGGVSPSPCLTTMRPKLPTDGMQTENVHRQLCTLVSLFGLSPPCRTETSSLLAVMDLSACSAKVRNGGLLRRISKSLKTRSRTRPSLLRMWLA